MDSRHQNVVCKLISLKNLAWKTRSDSDSCYVYFFIAHLFILFINWEVFEIVELPFKILKFVKTL